MNISFAITTHNEGECIDRLLFQLQEYIEGNNTSDEIIILDDFSEDPDTVNILDRYSNLSYVQLHQRKLNRNFANHKNYLNSLCSNDYIFQIDADEYLISELLENLESILNDNHNIDLFFIPRINTVEGLTEEHINMWGWSVNEYGWVLYPDYQSRIFRNTEDIMWVGQVHERIQGHTSYAMLPAEERFSIIHEKTISKQEEQNSFYSDILQQD